MLIIPAIDLRNGRCVRLVQGRDTDATVYDADPVDVARGFAEAGAELLHVVDLDAAFGVASSPNNAVIEQIVRAVGIPVEVGGGMRSAQAVRSMFERGAAYTILGTLAVRNREVLRNLVDEFGERIVVGIDARDRQVMTHGWAAGSGIRAIDFAREVAQVGVRRIIYTDVGRDGMLEGINLEQTAEVARVARVRVTASGGIGSLDDIRRLVEFDHVEFDHAEFDYAAHAAAQPIAQEAEGVRADAVSSGVIDSVIVGKALYENRFTLRDALRVARGLRVEEAGGKQK